MHIWTDDRGEFWIVGAPGKFYVVATARSWPLSVPEIRSDGTAIPVYGKTWHPPSESQDRAVVVEALAGRETAGIDIRLLHKRNLKISGVVAGTPEGPARAAVHLGNEIVQLPARDAGPGRKIVTPGSTIFACDPMTRIGVADDKNK
jgi:hypothetical protein